LILEHIYSSFQNVKKKKGNLTQCYIYIFFMWCRLFTSIPTAEGQTQLREHNKIGSAKCGREKFHSKGKLPLREGNFS